MSPPITTRVARSEDLAVIKRLHAEVFGPGRFARSAYRAREGAPDISPFCRVALQGDQVIAALRFTAVVIGNQPRALLLGPLAVDPAFKGQGYGRQLVAEGIDTARAAGIAIVVLVGDEPYYGRFGFVRVPPGQIVFPGPADPARILAAELEPGALDRFRGKVMPDSS
jgi:predicted N-acetyltransferase YhbS